VLRKKIPTLPQHLDQPIPVLYNDKQKAEREASVEKKGVANGREPAGGVNEGPALEEPNTSHKSIHRIKTGRRTTSGRKRTRRANPATQEAQVESP